MKRLLTYLTAGVLALSLLVPGVAAREEPGTGAGWVVGTPSLSYENVLWDLINDEHQRVCGAFLQGDVTLDSYSRYKAADMGWHNYFAHADESGQNYWQLYPFGGITYSGTNASEILAYNTYDDALSPGAAYNAFMASSPHRNAIRNCTFTEFGVGSFKQLNGTTFKRYWAVEFIRP